MPDTPYVYIMLSAPNRHAASLLGVSVLLLAAAGGEHDASLRQSGTQSAYEVHAIRYGTLSQFPVASLVAGAEPSRRMDIALMVWLMLSASLPWPRFDAAWRCYSSALKPTTGPQCWQE
jgi:hypothetical protein